MVKGKIELRGLNISSNQKWYCNNITNQTARCCDTYNEEGSLVQRISRYILTGEEDWAYNPQSKCYYYHAENKYYDEIDGGRYDTMLCTHFRWSEDMTSTPLYMFSGGIKNEIQFNYDNGTGGLNNFIDWIKKQLNTKIPVEVVYISKYPCYFAPDSHKRVNQYLMNVFNESLKKFNE